MARMPRYKTLPAHGLLVTWGHWLRSGQRIGLLYPQRSPFWLGPAGVWYEFDEELVAEVQAVVVDLLLRSRDQALSRLKRDTYALFHFLIKIEYAEATRAPREALTDHVRARFRKRSYTVRSLLNHLTGAVVAVQAGLKARARHRFDFFPKNCQE